MKYAAITKTDFSFPGQKSVYRGKVRDVYNINDELLIMIAGNNGQAQGKLSVGQGADI